MKLSGFSKNEIKEILVRRGWNDVETWERRTVFATKKFGVYRLMLFVTHTINGGLEGVELSLVLFREIGLDNTFRLYRKDVELDDELLNLELVKIERTLRTFERYCTSGCEVLVTELKEALKG